MNITQEILDAYVLNEMNDSDKAAFEQKIKSDKKLADDIRVHEHTINGLEAIGFASFKKTLFDVEESLDQKGFFSDESEKRIIDEIEIASGIALKDMLQNVESDLEEKSFFEEIKEKDEKVEKGKVVAFPFQKILSIAASVLIIITAAWYFWPKPVSSDELYEIHFAALTDDITDDINAEMGEIGFAEGDAPELQSLKEAMQLYAQGDYSIFLSTVENLSFEDNLRHYAQEVSIYKAVAHMKMKEFDKALALLLQADQNDSTKWYISLIYLQKGETEMAKAILQSLENSPYKTQVQEILSRLNKK